MKLKRRFFDFTIEFLHPLELNPFLQSDVKRFRDGLCTTVGPDFLNDMIGYDSCYLHTIYYTIICRIEQIKTILEW